VNALKEAARKFNLPVEVLSYDAAHALFKRHVATSLRRMRGEECWSISENTWREIAQSVGPAGQ
jgi:hypothetical protein